MLRDSDDDANGMGRGFRRAFSNRVNLKLGCLLTEAFDGLILVGQSVSSVVVLLEQVIKDDANDFGIRLNSIGISWHVIEVIEVDSVSYGQTST
ncbi:hypothetical protein AXG93_4530s1080 [Marchantia polymorpha subsp. ruderalis]|uniref:Uncharacterized protein n=1 Tax=Marchantia polymorpha subsp. ruderalis TaxID=1480154 RepID=A0A176VWZ3_MARPO|nr:hypothetical protein AXG93_4530s1080 [Marchantia polymorpha subsp. ruderalis]